QYNRREFSAALRQAGLHYRHLPGLGGRRRARADSKNTGWKNSGVRGYADYMQTRGFEKSLTRCIGLARGGAAGLMCAGSGPGGCHRSLIADALIARGVEAREITSGIRSRRHDLTPFAVVNGTTVTYPAS